MPRQYPQHATSTHPSATPPPPSREFNDRYPPSTSRYTTRSAARSSLYDHSTSNISHEHLESLRRQSNYSTLSLSPRRGPSVGGSGSTATTRATPRRKRSSKLHFASGGAAGAGEESGFGMVGDDMGEGSVEEGEGEEAPWTMVDRMRNWRNDAMTQHLYDSAKFWGGKVLGMTGNADDAFWLAQIHFLTHQYAQAERILTLPRPSSSSSCSFPIASTSSDPLPSAPTPAIRLTDTSLACRYLAAQCMVRLGKWEEALEMVGRRGGLGVGGGGGEYGEGKGDGGIKLTASAAHLRGLIHLHLKATDLAKEAFMEALSRDVKCFEAFEMLVGGEMMSGEEEWEFIQGLPFHAQTEEDAEFIRMMYTVRLKKLSHSNDMSIARQRLTDDYGLGQDPDVLFSRADELYNGMRFAECFKITTRILALHPSHRPTLPLHLSCMHHLPNLRSKLFLLAHEMVETEPDDAISWYAVGLWYFAGKRWEESRRFFGKSVLIDPRFGPSWLAYAHSFAYEGEHEQAITAYSTAQRHLPGSHLPLLFIGMQHLGLGNVGLAEEYVLAAREVGKEDPLVVNELGVIALHNQQYDRAVQSFRETLVMARIMQSSPSAWATTHLNLGHAYRKLSEWDNAYTSFRRVIELDPRHAGAYSGLGIVEHQRGNYQEAIARYHEALALHPSDPLAIQLLSLSLETLSSSISATSASSASGTAKGFSSSAFPFPGLPPRTIRNIDEQVRRLDEEIRLGVDLPPLDGDVEGEEERSRGGGRSIEEEDGSAMLSATRSEGGFNLSGVSNVSMSMQEADEGEGQGSAMMEAEGDTMDITGD
ncbi:hypothetical protein JCM11251_006205 [Rhodosporidiobolus azoricus]